MGSLGWDDSQILTNTTSLWNNPQHASTTLWSTQGYQESLLAAYPSAFPFSGKTVDLTEDIYNKLNSNSDKRQETSRLFTINTPLAKSGVGTNSLDGFGFIGQSRININGLPDGMAGASTSSFESLDCLLAATNSNTDASFEDDDGISAIFSNRSGNSWNFGTNNASSSGESGNNTSNARNKETCYWDETVGQSTTRHCQTNKPPSTKRSHGHTELEVGYFDILQTNLSTREGGFRLIAENPSKPKRPRSENKKPSSSNINFQQPSNSSVSSSTEEPDPEAIAQMKEMIYRAAAFRPVNLGLEIVEKPKRKNVRISNDPQTMAARQRRERISERIRVLQKLVPGGSKMDTASMLDEAANYIRFLRSQVKALENLGHKLQVNSPPTNLTFSSSPFSYHSDSRPMQISSLFIPPKPYSYSPPSK